MRFSPNLAIAAVSAWLPPGRDDAAGAVAAGRADAETVERLGYRELAVSAGPAGPELAALAAGKALAEAGWSGAELDLVVHAWTYHQGHDFWSPPHYVAAQVGADAALAVGVQQMCNGGAAALEVAAARLAADPRVRRCLVTTGDRFDELGFDRWCGDYDVAYGDAGTALLLGREPGPYALLSVVSAAAPRYEAMHRGDDDFSPAPRTRDGRVDVRATKRAFMATGAGPEFERRLRVAVKHVVGTALAEAGLRGDDPRVRALTLPRIGLSGLAESFDEPVAELGLRHAEVLNLGLGSGHLGGGDSAANLADLHATQALAPGEVALLLSVGGGFTWSCIAVQAQ
jgi:3-oxoacyl-[acyl-carrier-protein] synthase-3